jgi:hypothetical protein
VIYDLARKEHTAYSLKDFMTEKTIESLPPHGYINGIKWHVSGQPYFNKAATKFVFASPALCEEENVPFTIIYLPTRSVAIVPEEEYDHEDLKLDPAQKWGWRFSEETIKTEKTELPKTITWECSGLPSRVLELAPNQSDYLPLKKD